MPDSSRSTCAYHLQESKPGHHSRSNENNSLAHRDLRRCASKVSEACGVGLGWRGGDLGGGGDDGGWGDGNGGHGLGGDLELAVGDLLHWGGGGRGCGHGSGGGW